MISSKYRFHSRGGVKYTYKNGQTIRHQNINLIYNKNTRGKQRFAAVVSKKILKSAVGRNRIRRRSNHDRRTRQNCRSNSNFKEDFIYCISEYNPFLRR